MLKDKLVPPSNLKDMTQVPFQAPAPPAPQMAGGSGVSVIAPAPSVFSTSPDSLRQFEKQGTSQVRIMPLPSASATAIGATAASQAAIKVRPVQRATAANTSAIAALQAITFQGAWSATTSYVAGAQVDFGGIIYVSLQNANVGNQPDTSPSFWQNSGGSSVFEGVWSSVTAYVPGNSVVYTNTSTGVTAFYICIANSTNNPPSSSPAFWQVTGSSSTYVNLGVYNNGTTYYPGNQVTYNPSGGGSQYWICISPTTGNAPTQASSFWELVGTSAANLNGLDGVAPSQTGQNLVFNGDFSVSTVPSGLQSATASAIRVQDPGTGGGALQPSANGWTRNFEGTTEGYIYQAAGNVGGGGGLVGPFAMVMQNQVAGVPDKFAAVSDAFSVRAGVLYTISANFNIGLGSGFPTHATWYFRVLWYKVGATDFSRSSTDFISFNDIVAASTASGAQAPSGTLTAPANAGYCRIAFYQWNDGTAPSAGWNLVVSNVRCVNTLDDVNDGTSRFGQTASGLSYRPTSNPLTASDAGANATISIAAFTQRTSSKGDISVSSGSVTALSYGTLYYVYYDDAALAGGAVTYNASTTKATALSGSGRFYVGSILTPVAGAPNTVGNNDGGAGAQSGGLSVLLPTTFSFTAPFGFTNPTKAYDNDFSTAATAISNNGSTSHDELWQGFGAGLILSSVATLTLRVDSSVTTSGAGTGSVTLQYSTNGGSSFTGIYTATGARSKQLDSVTLPAGTNFTQVIVQAVVTWSTGAAFSITGNVFELWMEVQS